MLFLYLVENWRIKHNGRCKADSSSNRRKENKCDRIGHRRLNYTHVFKKPFEFEGKTYDKLTFDFEGLLGSDMIAVENEMAAVGEYVLSPEISTSFLSKMAARAAGVGSDLIEHFTYPVILEKSRIRAEIF